MKLFLISSLPKLAISFAMSTSLEYILAMPSQSFILDLWSWPSRMSSFYSIMEVVPSWICSKVYQNSFALSRWPILLNSSGHKELNNTSHAWVLCCRNFNSSAVASLSRIYPPCKSTWIISQAMGSWPRICILIVWSQLAKLEPYMLRPLKW